MDGISNCHLPLRPPVRFPEVTFSTKGDFKIGFFQSGEKGSVYVHTGYVVQASSFMEVEDFPDIKSILDKGLSLLKQK
jgi:hypothetical protein